MAGYTATLEVSAHKIHECVLCGAVFRYVMKRSCSGTGGTQEAAKTSLVENVKTTMEGGVDTHPCPTCGMVQPEMVGAERSSSHTMQAVAAGLVTLVLAILMGSHAAHLSTACQAGVGLYGGLAAWAFMTASRNPNGRLAEGQSKAQAKVAAGTLVVEDPGDKTSPRLPEPARTTDGRHQVGFALLAAAVFLALAPEALRLMGGHALNPRFYPAVLGPGDTSTFYFAKEIHSVKGYWRGKAVAAILDAEGLGEDGVLPCEAAAKDKSWGKEMRVKSSEKSQGSTIYAAITIPAEPALAGREVELGARIVYQYPKMDGGSTFSVASDKLDERTPVKLAGAGAGAAYSRNCWAGVMGGGLALLAACILLAVRAGKLDGNPRKTVPVQ